MTLTTATLGDHLAAQGVETNELYSRGARVRKRETAVDANGVVTSRHFEAAYQERDTITSALNRVKESSTSIGVVALVTRCASRGLVQRRPSERDGDSDG